MNHVIVIECESAQAARPRRAGGGAEDDQQRPAGAGYLALPAAGARAHARAGRRAAAAHAHDAPVGAAGVRPLGRGPEGALLQRAAAGRGRPLCPCMRGGGRARLYARAAVCCGVSALLPPHGASR